MRIIKTSKSVVAASDSTSGADLKGALKSALDSDICEDIVNLAYSEDNVFAEQVFIESESFFDALISEDPKDVALMFFNGKDLDARGPANPNRDYFRTNKYDNVESTDYPGEIYEETIFDDILDYIIEHISDREFPKMIQEIISKYNVEESEK